MKYERQIVAFKKKTKIGFSTFCVDDYLEPKQNEEDGPLELHAGYSRYLITILETNEGLWNDVTANIPVKDVINIKGNYDRILILKDTKDMLNSITHANNVSLDSEEPKIFSLREFSGMKPSEILAKDSANKQKLLEHIKVLEDNLSKYPKNRDIIVAINKAIENMDNNVNEDKNFGTIGTINKEIYHPAIKYFRTKKEGLNLCYEIKITYNDGLNYPVIIEISNFYAKVVTKDNGTTTIEASNKKDLITKKYLFTVSDFDYVINRMVDNIRLFENSIYADKRNIMNKYKYKFVSQSE